ncbi:hypothetical protein HAV22_10825 [Massilia sp. TW-1]|uniref:PEGA domain-containing protein n=1 Tax=Telluria antibiotica TaxID=2717319 RepID=A0ABX0PA10_9BURK|nr:hypothetical protein [Telluria antibiotica]NIA54128.1 hypothetical protein [Telluria antibiotica]
MTSPTTIGPEPQHLEGRSVRDIVEYSPEQVNEAWCRKIFRKTLQSLELQYAMHMPHRAITPDTIVFHENGEPLLVPSDDGPADGHEADDLNALARVVHYAITCELAPMGPLAGRAEGYSDSLVNAVDRCMDPDPARRPRTIDDLRGLLGIVPPGRPAGAAFPDDPLAPWPADVGAPDATSGLAADRVPEAAPTRTHDAAADVAHDLAGGTVPDPANDRAHAAAPDLATNLSRGIAAGHAHDRALDAATGSAADVSRHNAAEYAHDPALDAATDSAADLSRHVAVENAHEHERALDAASDVAPATAAVPPPEPAPVIAPASASPAPAHAHAHAHAHAIVPDADLPRRRVTLTSRQRWAIAAGAAIVVALGAVLFAEMRDSGSFDHIVLTLPQQGDGTRAGQDAASAPPAAGANPASGAAGSGTAGTTASSAGQSAPGVAPGTFITDDAPAAAAQNPAPAASAATTPLPGVVVTPNGNLYKLHIQPWGVVYVDGVDRGVSPPVKRLELTPGRHAIRVTNPNFHDRVLEIDTANGDGRIHVDFNEAPR